jgi:hypothetical protein
MYRRHKMFKGKSTIELFDGITGKKKSEYTDENYVTNALQNMFGAGSEMLAAGMPVHSLLNSLTPIYPAYLRGILLWDSLLPDNRDMIYAPPGVRCVGHASSAYSGAKPTRGTLNVAETQEIPNGVRMVWDFGTDKANGTIRAVSLTSVWGGDAGWMTPHEAGTFFRNRPGSNPADTSPIANTVIPSSLTAPGFTFIGEFRRGVYTYVAADGNNLTVLEKVFTNPSAIGLFNKVGNISAVNGAESQNTVTSTAPFSNLVSNHIIDENMNFSHVLITNSTTARIRIINPVTRAMVSDRTITLSDALGSSGVAFFKNRLYAHSSARGGICEFNENGQFIRVMVTAHSAVRFFCIGDYLISNFINNGFMLTDGINAEIVGGTVDHNMPMTIRLSSLKAPLFTDSTERPHAFMITPYMATVNNLDSPVTKNSQNTMKITYEITQT